MLAKGTWKGTYISYKGRSSLAMKKYAYELLRKGLTLGEGQGLWVEHGMARA